MRDLRIINESENYNKLLSEENIEFIELIESSISTTVNARKVSGKHGTNKSGLDVGDTQLTLYLRFDAHSTIEYFKMERKVKEIFSRDDSFTIAPMYNDEQQYEFVKIGQSQPAKSKPEELYYYDVLLDGDFKLSRNGHLAEIEVPLITSTSPYRYLSKKIIDLSKPTNNTGGKLEYSFTNNGNINQNSRSFELNLQLSGVSGAGVTITSGGLFKYTGAISPSDKLIFNGYSTKIGSRNVTNLTNYGTVDIPKGTNKISITGITGTPTGNLIFKEYIR